MELNFLHTAFRPHTKYHVTVREMLHDIFSLFPRILDTAPTKRQHRIAASASPSDAPLVRYIRSARAGCPSLSAMKAAISCSVSKQRISTSAPSSTIGRTTLFASSLCSIIIPFFPRVPNGRRTPMLSQLWQYHSGHDARQQRHASDFTVQKC